MFFVQWGGRGALVKRSTSDQKIACSTPDLGKTLIFHLASGGRLGTSIWQQNRHQCVNGTVFVKCF